MKNEWGGSRKRGGEEEEVGDAKQAKVEEEKMEAEVKGKGSLKQKRMPFYPPLVDKGRGGGAQLWIKIATKLLDGGKWVERG